ncbi:MAG: hypothetical protein SGI83_07695 [Bacteroidota bacterium]|nr:hypothetical protein [Bacteroidota bacterium]
MKKIILLICIISSHTLTAQNVGIGTATPVQKLHVEGATYLNGNVGIGNSIPAFPLSFAPALGDKISLWSNSTNSYGFGIQSSQLQIHTDISAADIVFGYGSSAALTERMRIKGTGQVGIGTATPDASAKLDVNSTSSGFLPPRMTTAQRDAIAGPVPGLMIFNSSTQTIDFYTLYGWSSIKVAIAGGNKLLGGNGDESSPSIQKTSDGGYIVAGSSTSSANGDVTGTLHGIFGNQDIWIVKLNATGTIVWNKLLGGNNAEVAYSVQQTTDGGYIVAGFSSSSATGDVTGVNHGGRDYWIVKLDGSGNIVWNKLLGGNYAEEAYSIVQTTDGGYIVAGYSQSSANGDVTGTNHGSSDYWIVKLDNSGNIVWNKLLGGNLTDLAYSIVQTTDGGYIVTGNSTSSANGDVTGTNHGSSDYWIVKLDNSGNIVWNKLLGGSDTDITYSIQQTTDGGYIVAGESFSSANGDVTGTNHGVQDYWIVKLDGSGNIIWNKLLGGSGNDITKSIVQTTDGGYIVAGYSASPANGDVSGVNHGGYDYWIVKLDGSGNIVWNKLLGGSGNDIAYSVQQTADGGYIVAGTSYSSSNGDVTPTNHGSGDFWIIKLDANGNIL